MRGFLRMQPHASAPRTRRGGIVSYSASGPRHAATSHYRPGRRLQPIANEDETVHLIFNGEIYNYRELRRDLIHRGHHFRTNGDSEVIVHAYEEFGERCVEHLDGMFAFAIYDGRPVPRSVRAGSLWPAIRSAKNRSIMPTWAARYFWFGDQADP